MILKLCFSFILVGFGFGAILPSPSYQTDGSWYLPGDRRGILLEAEKSAVAEVRVPELTEKEAGIGGEWRGVLGVDLYGTTDGGAGAIRVEVLDPATGEVFATSVAKVEKLRAPRAKWAVIFSSEQGGAEAAKAFDGDPKTDWHTRYSGEQERPPHWLGVVFGEPTRFEGISVLPRQGGFTNGVPRDWRLEVMKVGGSWEEVAKGTSDQKEVANKRKAFEIRLAEAREVEGFRFVIERDWSGGGFGTAAEVVPFGVDLGKAEEAVQAGARAWLEVPAELMGQLTGKSFGLRVTSLAGKVVVGEPHWSRLHTAPSKKLYGRSNGGLGPDELGVGILGFMGLTEHRQTVLSVMATRDGGPAAKAGLVPGDVIVSVEGEPLPINDLNPGWDWFERSHEAVLGRMTEAALAKGQKRLSLGVLREGKVVEVPILLDRRRNFTTMNPANDPEAEAMLADLLEHVVKIQGKDGSWSGDMKRTMFGALALLATGEKKHEAAVKRAIDWSLDRYPTPDKHGNLGFWGVAFMGILYSEWHLHSGDDRVMSHLEAMRDWAYDGQHPSLWEVPALGHGPDGLPYGEKALVAPACHLLVAEALAMRCGMKDRLWELLMPYMEMSWSDPKDGGHGALGYNRSYKDLEEFWSRTGLFAMACHLRGERTDMRDAMTKIMFERHPWIRNSHAYGEPGGGLGLLGLQLIEPEKYGKLIQDYGWWFSMAWEPGYGLKFTQPHMGAPYMGEDDLMNVVYALVLQAPKRNLHLTGKVVTSKR